MRSHWISGTLPLGAGLLWLVSLALGMLGGATAEAQPIARDSNAWAIVIGVEHGATPPRRAYRTNDAEMLAATLLRCGYPSGQMRLMTRRAALPAGHPLGANLARGVEETLDQIGPKDQLLLYFAGPASRDRAGQSYLAAADWDPTDPDATGLPVPWLRERLEACPAQLILLVLDIPGGDAADAADAGAWEAETGQKVGEALEGVHGLTILTSCRAGEQPLGCEQTEQSLFGFYFSQAIAGHADRNSDHRISIGELHPYVLGRVPEAANRLLGQPQTPVRLGERVLIDDLTVSRLQYPSVEDALDEMAEQLTAIAVQHDVSQLGVTEFLPMDLLGPGPVPAGRWCAQYLEDRLRRHVQLADRSLELIPHDPLHAMLVRSGFTPTSLRTAATRSIQVHERPMEAMVVGSFCTLTGPVLTLRADLQNTASQQFLGRVQVTALLKKSELPMFGIDLDGLGTPPAPRPDVPEPPLAHPLVNPEDYRVAIYVDGRVREATRVGTNTYVPLSRDEAYQIVVENRSDQPVYLRLLVDGLNTLPEWVSDTEDASGSGAYHPARRVHPDEARVWWLGPRPPDAVARRYSIHGFYQRIGDRQYQWGTFRVVDAPQSVAYEQGYTEQVGWITATFHELLSEEPSDLLASRGAGGIGTGRGETQQGELEEHELLYIGETLRTVIIRYVEPETLDGLIEEADSGGEQPIMPEELVPESLSRN